MFALSATTAPAAALRRANTVASKPCNAPLRVQALAEPRSAAKQQKQSSPVMLGQAALAASLSALVVASTVAPQVAFAVRFVPHPPSANPSVGKTSNPQPAASPGALTVSVSLSRSSSERYPGRP